MATDRVSQTQDYDFSAWGFQRRGWGRRPSDALTHTKTEGMDPLPSRPGPRPLARPLPLSGHSEQGEGGGFLRAPPPLRPGTAAGCAPATRALEPRGRAPVRAGRAGRARGRGAGGPGAGPKPHPRGRSLAPGSVRKRKSAARGGAGARRAGAGPRRAPRGPPWPRTSWPAS